LFLEMKIVVVVVIIIVVVVVVEQSMVSLKINFHFRW